MSHWPITEQRQPRPPHCWRCRDDPAYRENIWSLGALWPTSRLCPFCKGGQVVPDPLVDAARAVIWLARADPDFGRSLLSVLDVMSGLGKVGEREGGQVKKDPSMKDIRQALAEHAADCAVGDVIDVDELVDAVADDLGISDPEDTNLMLLVRHEAEKLQKVWGQA